VNRFLHAYTAESFPNFSAGAFDIPKTAHCQARCLRGTPQTAQFWAMGIISGIS